MNMKLKKGYALVWAMILIIIASTVSIGIFRSTEFVAVETRMGEQERIRGYYATIAGLRYAGILLNNPAGNLEFTSNVLPLESKTLNATNTDFAAFCDDININANDLTVTIREREGFAAGGSYDVEAVYTIPKYSP